MAVSAGESTRGRRRLLGSRTPTRTAVYWLFDVAGRLLYVGIALDPAGRLSDHRRKKEWWSRVAYAEIYWFADRPIAEDEELRAIRTANPEFNIQGRGGLSQRRATPHLQPHLSHSRLTFAAGA